MSKGHDRERQLKERLEAEGWWVVRAAGSLGDADLAAARGLPVRYGIYDAVTDRETADYSSPTHLRLVEVKANADGGPYKNFGPEDRRKLSEAARRAGAEAWLVWWPPRREPEWIPESEWPENREVAA